MTSLRGFGLLMYNEVYVIEITVTHHQIKNRVGPVPIKESLSSYQTSFTLEILYVIAYSLSVDSRKSEETSIHIV